MGEKKKFVSINEAVEILNEKFGNDPKRSGRNVVAKGTIYNAISSKRLKAYGAKHFRQVDVEELLLEFGPQQSA